MADLLIPCAEAGNGRIVYAADAVLGEEYRCPSCSQTLILRAGQQRQKHFAHPSDGACSYESIIHQAAKLLIATVVEENASGVGIAISLEKACKDCKSKYESPIPDKLFSRAGVEVQVGKFRCDAVAYREDRIAIAFEILVSSPVSDEKISGLDVRWVELRAEDVLQDPYRWKPVRSHLKEESCPACQRIIAVATRWKIPENLYAVSHDPLASNYIAAIETCFNCKEDIPVFWWRGVPFCQESPPQPRPSTIQRRTSRQYEGAYWANTCPNCRALQGDNYQFLFESGPLKDLPKSVKNLPGSSSSSALDSVIKHMFRNI